MSDKILWASAQLNTSVQLPDIVAWELTERTNSWVNLLWLEDGKIQRLLKSERKFRQTNGRGIDRNISHLVRAKFRSLPDASVEDLQRVCQPLMTRAQEWPVVHYNGHSLPRQTKPEVEGVLWLNDARYSGKLEGVGMSEVHEWLGMPALFVLDCESAGTYLEGVTEVDQNMYLAGCAKNEKLPARRDLFSRLMSAPVNAAFEWHCTYKYRNVRRPFGRPPGNLCERQMVAGQLDWFLTLLVDNIARNALPADLFQQLFRGDLMVATMFRRFLLAQRVMRDRGCHPVSRPALPDCSASRLWTLWDQIMDMTVELLEAQDERECRLVETMFEKILGQTAEEYNPLTVYALNFSKTYLSAMDKLCVVWKKLESDTLLQRYAFDEMVLLLKSADAQTLPKVVNGILAILSKNSEAASFLCDTRSINLVDRLSPESDDDHVLKTVFLQLLFEQNCTNASQEHNEALRLSCVDLLENSLAEVRMWTCLMLISVGLGESTLLSQIENLLTDSSPRVRLAAMAVWVSAQQQTDKKDGLVDKILSMLSTNSNSLIRKELTHVLVDVASKSLQELVIAAKQENVKAPEPPKNTKAKSRQKQKRNAHQPTTVATSSKTAMSRVWSNLSILQSDPDPTIASTVQPLVAFVKQNTSDGGGEPATGKKSKKKVDLQMTLPDRESFQARSIREFLERIQQPKQVRKGEERKSFKHIKTVNGEKENDAGITNRSAVVRNPTLALLNHQLRGFQTQRAPELIHFGPRNNLAFAFKDRVAWQDLSGTNVHLLKPPSCTGGGNGDTGTPVVTLLFNDYSSTSNLLVGHRDGTVRLWQSSGTGPPTPASAWQALYDSDCNPPPKITTQLSLTAWDNTLLVAGDAKHLRLWDLEKEMLQNTIPSGLDHPIAAMAAKHTSQTIALGATDGTIKLVDLRAPTGKLATLPKHSKPLQTMSFCGDNDMTLVSICSGGSVHVNDCRKLGGAAPMAVWTVPTTTSIHAIHGRMGLVACGTDVVEIFSIHGEELTRAERAEKRAPASVAFHPEEGLMCVGYKDNTAVLFAAAEDDSRQQVEKMRTGGRSEV